MQTFNLIDQPWISVQMTDGSIKLMSLQDCFKQANEIYVLMLHEFKNRLRYWGYKESIDLFNQDKPWKDYFNRDFELFCVRSKELIATVVAYNSYHL